MTLGITGGIGSGKSYVSDILRREFGIPVYDCDKEAKRLTATDEEIRGKLVQLVGPEVFNGQVLNKKRLADFLFADAENASQVNAIIHPAVLKDFQRWKTAPSPIPSPEEEGRTRCRGSLPPRGEVWWGAVALESAILFESGFNEYVDKVLFVDAPEEVRLQRAMQRDSASREQVIARMKMQQPELHRSQADFVIDNSTTNDIRLQEQLRAILTTIQNN